MRFGLPPPVQGGPIGSAASSPLLSVSSTRWARPQLESLVATLVCPSAASYERESTANVCRNESWLTIWLGRWKLLQEGIKRTTVRAHLISDERQILVVWIITPHSFLLAA